MNLLEVKLLAEGQRIGIVAGRFNEFITSKLLGGALDAFKRHGGDEANIDLAWVPGAFEIPLVAKKMAETKKYDAVVCLGAVIRGATPHFDSRSYRLETFISGFCSGSFNSLFDRVGSQNAEDYRGSRLQPDISNSFGCLVSYHIKVRCCPANHGTQANNSIVLLRLCHFLSH